MVGCTRASMRSFASREPCDAEQLHAVAELLAASNQRRHVADALGGLPYKIGSAPNAIGEQRDLWAASIRRRRSWIEFGVASSWARFSTASKEAPLSIQ
jgi:hypothetical protein